MTNHTELREEFKKKFCWQDTDGAWLLNATPHTVPELINWWLSKFPPNQIDRIKEEVKNRIEWYKNASGLTKMVRIYVIRELQTYLNLLEQM